MSKSEQQKAVDYKRGQKWANTNLKCTIKASKNKVFSVFFLGWGLTHKTDFYDFLYSCSSEAEISIPDK